MKFLLMYLTTAESGYVTVPKVLQPVQVGTKKSSRIGVPVVFALAIASSRVFSQTMVGGVPLLSAITAPAMGIIAKVARKDKTYLSMVFLLF